MRDQLSELARRTRRWKFEAGTTELALGGILFSAALALLLPSRPTFSLILFIPGSVLTGLLVDHIQRRYVYPRIGFVEFRENTGRGLGRLLLMMIAAIIVLGGFLGLLYEYQPDTALAWVTPLLAVYVGAVMVLYGLQMRLRRLTLLGLISSALGLMFSPLVLGRTLRQPFDGLGVESLGSYLLAMGAVLLFSGACAFRNFLRRNPLPAEAPDEH